MPDCEEGVVAPEESKESQGLPTRGLSDSLSPNIQTFWVDSIVQEITLLLNAYIRGIILGFLRPGSLWGREHW